VPKVAYSSELDAGVVWRINRSAHLFLARGEESEETSVRTSLNCCRAQGTRRTPSCLYPNSCATSSSNATNDGCRSASTRTTNRSPSPATSPPQTITGTHPRGTLLLSLTRSEKLNRRISSFFMAPLPRSGEKLNHRRSCFIVVDVLYIYDPANGKPAESGAAV
jgi:hypothetical protein